nr:MAG TPA: hypothetical protein [Caudoviricetes sp.]
MGVNFLRASSELPNTCNLFLYAKSLQKCVIWTT